MFFKLLEFIGFNYMSAKKQAVAILIIVLIAFILRISPVVKFGTAVSYDPVYHERIALGIQKTGFIPEIDSSLGGRVYTYPPLYHVSLAVFSNLSGIQVGTLVMFFLPLIASIICFGVFIFARKFTNWKWAILTALLVAVSSPTIAASFDSPENFVFLFIPISLFLVKLKKNSLSGFFIASSFLWNYFAFLVAVVPFVLNFLKNKKLLKSFIVLMVLILIAWFWLFGFSVLKEESIYSGTAFVASNLSQVMPAMIFYTSLFLVPILLYSFFKLKEKEIRFLFYYCIFSLALLYSYFVTFLFRSWEQPKFLWHGCKRKSG